MKRAQLAAIQKDLDKKMVFLVGPRQAGKTWIAKTIAAQSANALYLNYDYLPDRSIIKQQSWLPTTTLLIFDELHKMRGWKNYLKGVYDTKPNTLKLLVTGSARLDIFHQVGDSLAGRYFLHHLFPLSISELKQVGHAIDLNRLLTQSGFPEPFLANELDAKRWRLQYVDSLLREDILDFNNIQNLRALQTVFELLRTKVGSPISYQALSEDVGVAPNTIKKYITILEALYIVFRLTPFSKKITRSLRKEPKIYFYDSGLVKGDDSIIFENHVAGALLKHVHAKIDYHAERFSLHYLRTKEQYEVDFALACEGELTEMIEVKWSDAKPSAALRWFAEKYGWPASQVVRYLKNEHQDAKIKIRQAELFLGELLL